MNKRKLANTMVSALGFGCMRLPIIGGDESRIDEPEATRMLHSAIEKGVDYVDTAYPYHRGNSELFVGKALKGGFRERVNLATKLPSWAIQNSGDFDRYLNEQLQRLQTDRIDFYLIHALNRGFWNNLRKLGLFEFIDRAKRDGRIQHAGFSFHDLGSFFPEIVDAYPWEFCQIQYNYMDEETQAGKAGLEYAASKGLGVIVMEPLRGGGLVRAVPQDIQSIWDGAETRRTPAEWGLRWVWNHPEVSVVLSGMSTQEQVEENCRIAEDALPNSLTAPELARIEQVKNCYRERIKVPCTACGYCMPCPQGVIIPRIFSLYNDASVFGNKEMQQRIYNGDLMISLKPTEKANNCVACGQCEKACPQGISIAKSLERAHQELARS